MPSALEIKFGKLLHAKRKELKLNQEAFGKLLGVKRNQIIHYEKGKNLAALVWITRMTKLLGISFLELPELIEKAKILQEKREEEERDTDPEMVEALSLLKELRRDPNTRAFNMILFNLRELHKLCH